MDGLLVIDKPAGITSRDAVNQVQRLLPRRHKIGHTGTLDPLATGVLVLCLGTATKLADTVQSLGKHYFTRIRLGATSPTDDADGAITIMPDASPPSRAAIEIAIAPFVGAIPQTPPAFSAVKVGGRRAHALARAGSKIELSARIVHVHTITIDRYAWPELDLAIDCGKGTYIRSIARDLGHALGVGGLVVELRRTRVGPFSVADALAFPIDTAAMQSALIPTVRLAKAGIDSQNTAML
jgi:tRNA pseudouridine55 synthase